tara:strand:+ start:111 stop:761 length:651 start_codon:yes stop_codon:yes gene_type:complete
VTPEETYLDAVTASHRKRFGQVFTPEWIADIMLEWVLATKPKSFLDPAVGTGVFLRRAARIQPSLPMTGFEVDDQIIKHQDFGDAKNISIIRRDFLSWRAQAYDAIVMNPPYIRHREIKDKSVIENLSFDLRVEIPKSANLYVSFVILACELLRPGGRCAAIIPAEWVSANFASSFKKYLINNKMLKEVFLFDHNSRTFPNAVTTASILLLEKPSA